MCECRKLVGSIIGKRSSTKSPDMLCNRDGPRGEQSQFIHKVSACFFCGFRDATGGFFRHRSRTDWKGIPSSSSYRSARTNQNARPPVLWRVEEMPALVSRTHIEPFRPVRRHPRPSIIIRTNTPIACRNRTTRASGLPEKSASIAGCASSSHTTPAKGARSWWSSDASRRFWRDASSKTSSARSKGCSESFNTSAADRKPLFKTLGRYCERVWNASWNRANPGPCPLPGQHRQCCTGIDPHMLRLGPGLVSGMAAGKPANGEGGGNRGGFHGYIPTTGYFWVQLLS